jgi:hypothetical protein
LVGREEAADHLAGQLGIDADVGKKILGHVTRSGRKASALFIVENSTQSRKLARGLAELLFDTEEAIIQLDFSRPRPSDGPYQDLLAPVLELTGQHGFWIIEIRGLADAQPRDKSRIRDLVDELGTNHRTAWSDCCVILDTLDPLKKYATESYSAVALNGKKLTEL